MVLQFKLILILLLLCASSAFNWKKCQRETLSKHADLQGSGAFLSTSEFMSSTGNCSALAVSPEDKRKSFIAENYEYLLKDISRGSGEYIYAYAKLHGCRYDRRKIYAERMKRIFHNFEGKNLPSDGKEIYETFESPFKDGLMDNDCIFVD